MKEKPIEDTLVRRCKAAGIWAVKAEGMARGFPDRALLTPWGETVYVETKSPSGELRPDQRRVIEALRASQHRVYVVRSHADIDWLMEEL